MACCVVHGRAATDYPFHDARAVAAVLVVAGACFPWKRSHTRFRGTVFGALGLGWGAGRR